MSQRIVSAVCVGLAIATFFLWMRVRSLGEQVDVLTRQMMLRPKVDLISMQQNVPPHNAKESQPVFRLIESTGTDGATNVGAPWSVERAMMLDSIQREAPLPSEESQQWMTEPIDLQPLDTEPRLNDSDRFGI